MYNILFYFTHVVVIVIVSNIIFWLKDIDPRFREGEDSNFHDVPTLMEHKQRLMAQGKVTMLAFVKNTSYQHLGFVCYVIGIHGKGQGGILLRTHKRRSYERCEGTSFQHQGMMNL